MGNQRRRKTAIGIVADGLLQRDLLTPTNSKRIDAVAQERQRYRVQRLSTLVSAGRRRTHYLKPGRKDRLAKGAARTGNLDGVRPARRCRPTGATTLLSPLCESIQVWDPLRDHPRFQTLLEMYDQQGA